MIKTILWDFDGVIIDSMKVRDWGFVEIFKNYERSLVDKLLDYHRVNGGLSRYLKIRYFFEEVLGESITEEGVLMYAQMFSVLMKQELIDPKNLIHDSVHFIKENYQKYNFHIVSGSDQDELKFLSKELTISQYFISTHGSPTPKKRLVHNLLEKHKYNKDETCLIGDSINDYDAAMDNNIKFFSYNNDAISHLGTHIYSFKNLNI